MHHATAFLSHSSADKALVMDVANRLARRGVIPWLDIHGLYAGDDMLQKLRQAIREQMALVLFLSQSSLGSRWVRNELEPALAVEDEEPGTYVVIPVFLGDELELVCKHEMLRTRWLHPDGDRVKTLGTKSRDPDEIADKLAASLLARLRLATAPEVAVIVDQRGDGTRTGKPELPTNIRTLEAPALVFRPDLGERSHHEVVEGTAWQSFAAQMKRSLGAIGPRSATPRAIRILGGSQLAVPFLLGQHFNRTNGVRLFCYDRKGMPLSLDLGDHEIALDDGNPRCDSEHESLRDFARCGDARIDTLRLLLMVDEYVSDAAAFLRSQGTSVPVAWVSHPRRIESSDQVVTLARDVKALLRRVGQPEVHLFTSLPFHVLPFIAALLTPHVLGRVTFMELRRHSPAEDRYVALDMPLV